MKMRALIALFALFLAAVPAAAAVPTDAGNPDPGAPRPYLEPCGDCAAGRVWMPGEPCEFCVACPCVAVPVLRPAAHDVAFAVARRRPESRSAFLRALGVASGYVVPVLLAGVIVAANAR